MPRKSKTVLITVSHTMPHPNYNPYAARHNMTAETFTRQRFYSLSPVMASPERVEHCRTAMALKWDVDVESVTAAVSAPKMKYRGGGMPSRPITKDEFNSERAIKYCLWLAARDGVEIPTGTKSRPVWSGVTLTDGKWERRIQAVEWGSEQRIYNTLKSGKRGAFLRNEFKAEISVAVPHWDFVPVVTEETLSGMEG